MLENSAEAKILTPPAANRAVVPGDGWAGAVRDGLLIISAVSSGRPAGLFDPGGVGTGH